MIQVTAHRGRAELRTGTLSGRAWHDYDSLMSELGAPWDERRRARSIALDLLPHALERIAHYRLGAVSFAPEMPQALRKRAERFRPNFRGLDKRLQPYQAEGIAYLRARWAALLGDDMGLGKTAQLLQAIEAPREARVLVFCPALAKGVWRHEASIWRPEMRVRLLSGKGSFAWPQPGEIVVTNYDILPRHDDPLPDPPERVTVICDEAHYLKGKSIRSKSAKRIIRSVRLNVGRAWGATGTPLDNRPPDLYNITDALGLASEWGGWPNFVKLFGGYKLPGPYGGMAWGRPRPEVNTILERIMLRRRKSQVLTLPPVTFATRPVELKRSQRADIDDAMSKSGVRVSDLTAQALAQLAQNPHIMTARRLLASAKLDAVVEWVDECEDAGEPVVLFSAHRGPVDAFAHRPGWRVITGDVSPEQRTKIAEDMQAGRLKGVAGTIRAMGVAITLTRPCLAGFVDFEWTPGANQQARDRLNRIGQKRAVTIYNFVADHPVDERVAALLEEKTTRQTLTVDAITTTPDSARVAAMMRLADTLDLEHL